MSTTLETTVTLETVRLSRRRIAPYVRHTPLELSYELSRLTGAKVYLKLESMQVTGSFKPRISFSKLLAVGDASRGAIAATAGGHGIGLSYAAAALGVPAHVYLPHGADPQKIETIRRNNADLTFFDSFSEAREAAVEEARRRDLVFVSAYNDVDVVSGSGTIGLEIFEDLPQVDLVITGMGGGSVISGTSLALRQSGARAAAWGVQPTANPVLATWLREGRQVPVETRASIAEGLGASIEADSITFPLAQEYVDDTVLVPDEEIRDAMRWLLEEHQLVVEPSGAAPVAALRKARPTGFKNIVVIVTGRNISRARYEALLAA